jgi:hypothetical protein
MSEVAEHFRETICVKLDAEHGGMLRVAAGTGAGRELRRTMHLTDRAVRQWADQAASLGRKEQQSAYGRLPPLTPELGHAVQKAASTELKRGLDAEQELIAQMVWGMGERLAGLGTEAPPSRSQHALDQIAIEAAEILLAAGRLRSAPVWVVDEANEALRDLARIE